MRAVTRRAIYYLNRRRSRCAFSCPFQNSLMYGWLKILFYILQRFIIGLFHTKVDGSARSAVLASK